MLSGALPKQIEALVDSLRKRENVPVSLTEIAAVTEVLIKTMQMYFRSVDLRIYQECQSLSEYISNARREIAALQPENTKGASIPRAGKELDAIVRATEEATNTIMEAAEVIMAADGDNLEGYKATVQGEVMRIFEACSFQDITGQRISKVVETLSYIEHRANDLKNILGIDLKEIQASDPEPDDDRNLMSGPALDGEGINQGEVDALMAGATPPPPTPAPALAPAQAEKKAKPQDVSGRPTKRGRVTEGEVEKIDLPKDKDGRTSQADIDALFG